MLDALEEKARKPQSEIDQMEKHFPQRFQIVQQVGVSRVECQQLAAHPVEQRVKISGLGVRLEIVLCAFAKVLDGNLGNSEKMRKLVRKGQTFWGPPRRIKLPRIVQAKGTS